MTTETTDVDFDSDHQIFSSWQQAQDPVAERAGVVSLRDTHSTEQTWPWAQLTSPVALAVAAGGLTTRRKHRLMFVTPPSVLRM